MAQKGVTVKLSEQWQNGAFKCFKRMIGGQRFYLSQDRAEAMRMALALEAKWKELMQEGRGWTPEVIEQVLAPFRPELVKPTGPARSGNLYAAIDAYLKAYRAQVSESRYLRHVIALDAYKAFQPDCPLTAIDRERLAQTVGHFVSRPKTARGTPMAVATVQTTVKAIHALFDFLDDAGKWESPRRFEKLFRVKYRALRTPLEAKREGQGPHVFTLPELQSLWKAATPRQRLYMGIALNIGETAQGIASLLKADLHKGNDGMWVIDRSRRKTGVRGIYPLWPEVQALVKAEMNMDEHEPRLFLSMDGKPLVWFHSTGRVDSIAKTWANLRRKCPKVQPLGYKHLRKTGATMIESLTGSDRVAELYLSHTGNTMAKRHYLARDFSSLADGLNKLYTHLSPLFAPSLPQSPPTAAA